MSLKTKLMTSAALLTLMSGAAIAEQHSEDATMTPEETTAAMTGYPEGWNEDLDNTYAGIADRPVAELIGMNVITEGGDDVGEIDNFIIMEDRLQAVVGVGGFLGLGEHDVALPLDEMTYDGTRIVISYTQEDLEAMPEYTEELEQMALAPEDTFRTRSSMEMAGATDGMNDMEASADESEEMAATQLEMTPGNTAEEELANASDGEVENELEEAGNEMADAADATGDAIEDGAENAEQMAENAGDATMNAAEEAGDEVAQAAEATENAVEEGAAEAEQMAENAGEATMNAAEEAGDEVAQAAEATENAVEEGAAEAEQMAENAGEATMNAAEEAGDEVAQAAEATENAVEDGAAATAAWFSQLDEEFADIADLEIGDLEGVDVATANGDVIGEVENMGTHNGSLVALVGIGGFLGLGEHDVALDVAQLSWDGEKFIVDGYSEEQLKAMPEVDASTIEMLDDDVTLRSQASM